MKRSVKRVVIIGIYSAIAGMIVGYGWWAHRPLPTCIDGIKNGNETSIDCGGSCGACAQRINAKDIQVGAVHVLYGGTGHYDIVAEVKNPNALYGAANVRYTITLIGADGSALAQTSGEDFILPTQQRYFIALNVAASAPPQRAELRIDDVSWVKFENFDDPDFVVENARFGPVKGGTNYAEAFGLVRNNSDFDFVKVRVYVILKDERGVPIAVNTNAMGALDAHAERDFTLTWPYRFPGTMDAADVEVYANVFDSQNFVQKYLPGGRFETLEE